MFFIYIDREAKIVEVRHYALLLLDHFGMGQADAVQRQFSLHGVVLIEFLA